MTFPIINFQFARAPGFVDPRVTFTRATTAMVTGPDGKLKLVAAGVPRFEYDPVTLRCKGYLSEQQRTNLFLRSQEFDNAAWVKTNITVTANTAVAPDGTTTGDTVTATGGGAGLAQSATITAGRGAVVSFYVKPGNVSFCFLAISDGTNVVIVWFNLSSKTVGTTTGGSGTVLFSQAFCEDVGRGWVRCSLEVTTATVTSLSGILCPCSADAADSANGNFVYGWGAQLEAEQTGTSVSSYIPTTTATVTRNADNWVMNLSQNWFHDQGGTLLFSVINRPVPLSYAGLSYPMYGGIADNAFNDKIYMYRQGSGTIGSVIGASAGTNPSSNPSKSSLTFVPGTRRRMGFAWAFNDLCMVVDNSAPITDSTQDLPVANNMVRLAVGGAPWGAVSQYPCGQCIFEQMMYMPARISNADLQAWCAA